MVSITNDDVNSVEQAVEMVRYYIQRWKSGCAIEKLQERDMKKTKAMIFMYSVIAVFIMNLTYIARVTPGLPCTILFDEDEWKLLYCVANRTKEVPEKRDPRRSARLKNRLARTTEILHPLRL